MTQHHVQVVHATMKAGTVRKPGSQGHKGSRPKRLDRALEAKCRRCI